MGYSIFIELNSKEYVALKKLFTEDPQINTLFDQASQWRKPVFEPDDIAYRGSRKPSYVICFNYGASGFEMSHALMGHIGLKLHKKTYWYDGERKLPCAEPWWREPKSMLSAFRRAQLAIFGFDAEVKLTEEIIKEIDLKWPIPSW